MGNKRELLKYSLPAAITAVVLIGLLNLNLSVNVLNSGTSSSSGISYHSAVCKEVVRADGQKEFLGCTHNYFSNEGKNITRDLLGYQPYATAGLGNVSVIGLGNSTGAGGATYAPEPNINYTNGASGGAVAAIPDCGLNPQLGTVANNVQGPNGNWSVTKTFTSSCNNEKVNQTALYNNTGANAGFFAANNFTEVTLQSGDQINVTWYIWVS